MLRRLLCLIVIAAVAVLASGCARRTGDDASIQIKGSDTMVALAQSWAAEFMKDNPEVRIAVTGGGSGTGIAALINGTTDLAASSREMQDQEMEQARNAGREAQEVPVATDAIVVAVHPSNPVSRLTIDQLSDIYTGRMTNWSQVGGPNRPIVVLSREKNSGTHVYFLEHVVRRGEARGPEQFAPRVLMMPSSQALGDEIAGNQGSIGYFGLGWFNEQRHKAIAVAQAADADYVTPSEDTAASGEYPIAREMYLYTAGEPSENVQRFIDFVLSEDGQQIVSQMDFVPIR